MIVGRVFECYRLFTTLIPASLRCGFPDGDGRSDVHTDFDVPKDAKTPLRVEADKTFRPMSREDVSQLPAKTKEVATAGKYELFKTSSHFDSTAKHPDWLGGDAPGVQAIAPPSS